MEKSRNNKILNYFILIKIFNGDRNSAIRFYLLVSDFIKNNKNIFLELNLFDDFEKIDHYDDIWANDIKDILWFIYHSNMQINWKDDKKNPAITVIKNKLKVNYSSNFISEMINIISNFKADISIEKILNNNGNIVHYDDEIYPKYFKENIDYPPICFFYEGNFNLLTKNKIISIVGTRFPSRKGIFYTEKIAFELMKMNSVIVSGLAKGVDSRAHLFCQNQGYKNVIAVIGTPISKFYPRENKDLQIWIKENGLLLSEYAEFELTLRFNFLRRNNFMSMISMISIVVEASDTSGTISQARHTLKNKRYLLTPKRTFDNPDNSWPRNFQEKFENFVGTFENKNEFLQKLDLIFEK